jgi:molybdopterin-guanine dinucleotide biosynthesis protein A
MKISHPLIIFAGGKSSRMGRDKALLPFGGYPTLTQYQLERFKPYFQEIYIGCKDKQKFDFEADFVEDLKSYEDSAPHIGLISAFEKLDTDTICVLSVDTPYFNAENFQKLLDSDKHDSNAIVARSEKGNQPLCAIYKRSILPYLKEVIAEKKYRFSFLFEKSNVQFVPFEKEKLFINLNTPEEYANIFKTSV